MNLSDNITKGSRSYKMYASRLEKLGITTFEDFLFHIPSRYEDFSQASKIAEIQPGETVTIQGNVIEMKSTYLRGRRIKSIQKATVMDETGTIQLAWFNQTYLTRAIQANATISASGKVEVSGRTLKMTAPTYEILFNGQTKAIHTGRLIPVYPETQGVTSKWLRRQIYTLLQELENIEDYLPEELITRNSFLSLTEAIKEIHFPVSHETAAKARERLAFDELFLLQLAARRRRESWKQQQKSIPFTNKQAAAKIKHFIGQLPFTLTQAQQAAVDDILKDLEKDKAMNRLLQGDVGSGKTIVAAIAMYATHLNGYQSVLMAPTEILAEQHYAGLTGLLEPLGVKVRLVTGSKKLTKEASDFSILVGTHAVLSDKIQFDKLGFIAIDEQQRFGVAQRGSIRNKGTNPHLLTMTATPIPRTVMLTMYGNLDVSYLREMPHGRKKIKTWLVPPEKREGAYDWIRKQVQETDSQAFIICPFIETSENMQTVKAAAVEYERLQKEVFAPDLPAGRQGLKLGLLHGKQKAKEKDATLAQFRNREFDILVATPVVEVGIDIPNATIIMIEAAERFGLAQLHQLRGRVGRGDKQSYCLLFAESTNEMTLQRLKSMETTHSGAELAEMDLKLRGGGDIYGTSQHGMKKLRIASFGDTDMIQRAKISADSMYQKLSQYKKLTEKLTEKTTDTVSQD
ncbi:MAG: ATP-dependent DNA helicase RecG [Patescibacteria group bacterium]